MDSFIKAFGEFLENQEGSKKVVKTIPMKPAWLKLYKEMCVLAEQAEEAVKKLSIKKKFLWATIETDTGDNSSMRVKVDTNEIEVFGDEKEKGGKSIKSPFVAM